MLIVIGATVVAAFALGGASTSLATPTEVLVRVEGGGETFFEGPVLTEGHDIRASSETQEHPCDGINPNDPENTVAGPTPTAAAVDAMSSIGETFDGRWYEGIDDYLIKRWGPQQEAGGQSWSLFVDNALLERGGCQYELHPGAEVLWAYGPSTIKRLLTLLPAGETAGAPPLAITARLGQPVALEVRAFEPKFEREPPPLPELSGSKPYEGAEVTTVETSSKGFESVQAGAPGAVLTDKEGKATVTFSSPGWHRLKATASGAIRSNRLDICVPESGASGCGAPPAEDELQGTGATGPPGQGGASGGGAPGASGSGGATHGAGGSGSGTTGTGGRPAAAVEAHTLRLDGLTLSALDDRARALHYRGRWRQVHDPGAWTRTVSIGAAGASVSVALAAGTPVFVLRDIARRTVLEVREGSRRKRVDMLARTRGGELLWGWPRAAAGTVELRVLTGSAGLNAVAAPSRAPGRTQL